MKIAFSRQFFEKHWSTKFHEYPSSGIWVVTFEHTDGRTDMKLRLAFRDFVKAS